VGTLSSARIAVVLGVRSWTHSLRSGQGARTTLRTKNHLMHPASQIQREKAKAQRFGTQNYRTPHQDAPQTDILRTEILSVRLRRSTMTPRPLELDVCTGPRTGMRTEIAGGGVMELGSWMGKALWDPLRCYRVTALSKGTLSATLPICTSGFEPHRCANGIEILRCGGKLVSSTPAAARPQKPSAADVGTYNGVRCRSGVRVPECAASIRRPTRRWAIRHFKQAAPSQ